MNSFNSAAQICRAHGVFRSLAMISATRVIAGIDAAEARDVLQSGDYFDEFRAEERRYQAMGIQSEPEIVFNHRNLMSGGQPVEAFEQVIQQVRPKRRVAFLVWGESER
jgi:predicted DsbA family dithiol-disulfide isomerase